MNSPAEPTDKRLDSWKEIATYLDRDVRTVQRWEKEQSLPVRRHLAKTGTPVYAFKSEIDTWLLNSQPQTPKSSLREFMGRRGIVAALGVLLILLIGTAAWWTFEFHLCRQCMGRNWFCEFLTGPILRPAWPTWASRARMRVWKSRCR